MKNNDIFYYILALTAGLLAIMLISLSGCVTETQIKDIVDIALQEALYKNQPVIDNEPDAPAVPVEVDVPIPEEPKLEDEPPANITFKDEIDLKDVIFCHDPQVKNWKTTTDLRISTLGKVFMEFDHKDWPVVDKQVDGRGVIGMVWIIATVNGKWYASTWDFLRDEKVCVKQRSACRGRTAEDPNNGAFRGMLTNFNPVIGQKYFWFTSGVCRGRPNNVPFRSRTVEAIW